MPDIKCEKCGETLKEDALSCWACGTLTPAGLRARGAQDDDDTWRQSVEAARQRQTQPPAVDPDAALQRALAQAGAEAPPSRRPPEPAHDLRLDGQKLASAAATMASLGALLAFLTVLGGLIAMVAGILSGGALGMLMGVAAFVFVGGLALTIFFQSRFLADIGRSLSDALHELRLVKNALWDLQHEKREPGGDR
jgi:hypothetical protein